MTDTQVLVVGAGPVGLVLAIDLAQRGVSVELIERNDAPLRHPKMERCNARTMEIFRRLGLAQQVRAASRFREIPMDVFVVVNLAEPPLVHLEFPSVVVAEAQIRQCHDGTLPLEPYQLISQYTLEPVLKTVAESLPNIHVRFGTELTSFRQDTDGIVAEVRVGGFSEKVTAQYLVGCDGGTSTVRKSLGIELQGMGGLRKVDQIFFRSEDLFDSIQMGKGRHYHSPHGAMAVQDDLQHFMLNVYDIPDGGDPADVVRDFLRIPATIEVLHTGSWNFHLLVAERYGSDRAFLAGDAAHLMIPTGGLGMNTGVGDAIDLSWKLAGTLAGWGGARLLSTYDAERRPIGLRNCEAAGKAAQGMRSWQELWTPEAAEDTPQGHALRDKVAAAAAIGHPIMHTMVGIELGYRYVGSPIIWDEPNEGPDPNSVKYIPTTAAGVRPPHVWLADGRALHDLLGDGYTLLRLGGTSADTGGFEKAMQATGVPFEVLEITDARVREVYERDLLLLRPDLHVVWRGNEAPSRPEELAAVAVGA